MPSATAGAPYRYPPLNCPVPPLLQLKNELVTFPRDTLPSCCRVPVLFPFCPFGCHSHFTVPRAAFKARTLPSMVPTKSVFWAIWVPGQPRGPMHPVRTEAPRRMAMTRALVRLIRLLSNIERNHHPIDTNQINAQGLHQPCPEDGSQHCASH